MSLLVYEGDVRPENVRHRQEVGLIDPLAGRVVSGLALAHGGRFGGCTSPGVVSRGDTYASDIAVYDPTRPGIVAAYGKNAEASVGTLMIYQPRDS